MITTKNFGFSALLLGGMAAAALGFAGQAAADTGSDASNAIASPASTSLVRDSFDASPTTYASPAATVVPWGVAVNSVGSGGQPWSSVSGVNQAS